MSHFLNSPVFTGSPQAPTPLTADNSTTIPTTAWVKSQGYITSGGSGITTIAIANANGVSGTSSGGTTPSLTIALGAITPTSVNGLTFTTLTSGFNIAGGTTPKTFTCTRTLTITASDDTSTLTIPAGGGTLGSAAFTATTAYEAALGNPVGNNYVLSSTSAGVRSWVATTGSGSIILNSSPSIATPTFTGGATFSTGTSSVSSGATLNIPSGATLSVASGATFTSATTPSGPTDVVNKSYVDSFIQGIQHKPTARVATTAALSPANTYNNGTAGVVATLTALGNGILTVDGVNTILGDVILVKNEVTQANNGLYTVTVQGTSSVPYVLTRSSNMDAATEYVGAFIPVDLEGTTNKNSLWLCTTTGAVTVGSTAITFIQLNGATDLVQGTGISISGNTINVASVPNSALTNSSLTIGSTSISLGAIQTTLAGLTSVAATTFTGAFSGNASTATSVAGGSTNQVLYQSSTGNTAFATSGNYGVVTTGSSGVPTVTAGAAGVLQGSTTVIPAWTTTPTLTGTNFSGIPGSAINSAVANATLAASATAVASGAANQILYQSGAGVTAFLTTANYGVVTTNVSGTPSVIAGAAGVLQGSASANPAFTTTPTLTGTNFSGIPWSALPSTGSKPMPITATAKTTIYQITTADQVVLCDATSSAFVVTLTASPAQGENYTIKKIDSTANAITLAGNGKNIDGAASQTIPAQWNAITVVYNGTAWYII